MYSRSYENEIKRTPLSTHLPPNYHGSFLKEEENITDKSQEIEMGDRQAMQFAKEPPMTMHEKSEQCASNRADCFDSAKAEKTCCTCTYREQPSCDKTSALCAQKKPSPFGKQAISDDLILYGLIFLLLSGDLDLKNNEHFLLLAVLAYIALF